MTASRPVDCRDCGACCVNLPTNRTLGFIYWVEISDGDAILDRADLVEKHVVRDKDGVPHLRILQDGRCAALRGIVGTDVWCSIYPDRPSPCRKVEPGDANCLRYRREHQIK